MGFLIDPHCQNPSGFSHCCRPRPASGWWTLICFSPSRQQAWLIGGLRNMKSLTRPNAGTASLKATLELPIPGGWPLKARSVGNSAPRAKPVTRGPCSKSLGGGALEAHLGQPAADSIPFPLPCPWSTLTWPTCTTWGTIHLVNDAFFRGCAHLAMSTALETSARKRVSGRSWKATVPQMKMGL